MGRLVGMSEEQEAGAGDEGQDQSFDEKADTVLDAAIEKMMGPEEDPADDDGDLHVARAGKGKQKPEADEDDDDEESGQEKMPEEDDDLEEAARHGDDEGDEDGEADEDEESKEDAEDELDGAYATLLGLPKAHRPLMSDLKNMPRAKLIAWAKRVEDASAESEGSSSGAKQGRAATAGAKAEGNPPKEEASAKARATMRASIAEKLGVDEDAAEAVMPLYDTIETLRAEVQELRSEREQESAETREREGRATIDREVRRLERVYPGLRSDDEKVRRLVNVAAALIKGGAETTARGAFDKAARAELGKAKRADLAQLRRNGTGTPPERRGGFQTADLGEDEFWNRATDLAYSGRSDLIRRLKPPKPSRR